MIDFRVLGTAAVMALLLPLVAPAASHAQNARGAVIVRGGGGGGAPVARFSGGGGVPMGGGAPIARFNGGGAGPPVARFYGGGGPAVAQFNGGGGGYRYRHHGGGFVPGLAAGAVIGAIIASPGYAYYGGPAYYNDQYYDGGAVAPAPAGDDAVAYCMQTYQSYDPQSGTYLGPDGLRHLCP